MFPIIDQIQQKLNYKNCISKSIPKNQMDFWYFLKLSDHKNDYNFKNLRANFSLQLVF